MNPARSKTLRYLFTFFISSVLLLGMQPVLPVQADALAQPLLANGDLIWANAVGGADTVYTVGVVTDADGSTYVAGVFRGTVDFDPGPGTLNLTNAGDYDSFVVKLDANGSLLWAKAFGGPQKDQVQSIRLDPNGNVLTTGYFSSTADFDPGPSNYPLTSNGPGTDVFISKLDGNGNFVWARAMGGSGTDSGEGIANDALGYVYTTGSFEGTADFDPDAGTYNLVQSLGTVATFISKLNNDGTFVWARALEGTFYVGSKAILVDSNYDVYTIGNFHGDADLDPGAGSYNLSASIISGFISHLNADGNFVRAKLLMGLGPTSLNELELVPGGGLYVSGFFTDTLDLGASHLVSAGLHDGLIAKLDGNDDFIWARSVGGPGEDFVNDIATDLSGEVYATGEFRSTVDFDPGAGTAILTSTGQNDIFVMRFNQSGDFVWAKSVGGTDYDNGFGIAVTAGGDLYATGFFVGTADFDPGPGVYSLVGTPGVETAFVVKLSNDVTPVVLSIVRASADPTTAQSVDFTVTFSEPVTGVDTTGPAFDDFTLTTDQYITNAFIVSTSGSDSTYTVWVNTGQGAGTIHVDAITSGSIVDMTGNPLYRGLTGGEYYTINRVPTFEDIPFTHWASSHIERLYHAGITTGCSNSPMLFCPNTTVSRAQMAVLLLRSKYGLAYIPPAVGASTGFSDVSTNHWAAAWIKQLAAENVTSGCGGSYYCPEANISRDQLAIFLLRALYGSAYTPPPASGTMFSDVPQNHWAAAWIEQLAREGITSGCTPTSYCPSTPVSRAQMAVLLVAALGIQ